VTNGTTKAKSEIGFFDQHRRQRMQTSRRKLLSHLPAVVAGLSLATPWTRTFAFDGKPVRMVIPFPPGGITDALGRRIAESLRDIWSTPVVVENRPGGSGVVAATAVKGAPPDGRTLFMGHLGTHAANVTLLKPLPYDPVGDFTPIGLIADSVFLIMVNASVRARNLADLVSYAKANPGKLNFASVGNGSASHLFLEMFMQRAGVSVTHVPFKGSAQAFPELLSGRIDAYMGPPSGLTEFLKNGQLRALAVLASSRVKGQEDVPTTQEAGLVGFTPSSWLGLLASGNVPAERRDAMSADLQTVVRSPSFTQWCEERYLVPRASTAPEFARFMERETASLRQVISTGKITVD
jgi:tripartite-type tricarboxylate transporter receptor subunit TctC